MALARRRAGNCVVNGNISGAGETDSSFIVPAPGGPIGGMTGLLQGCKNRCARNTQAEIPPDIEPVETNGPGHVRAQMAERFDAALVVGIQVGKKLAGYGWTLAGEPWNRTFFPLQRTTFTLVRFFGVPGVSRAAHQSPCS